MKLVVERLEIPLDTTHYALCCLIASYAIAQWLSRLLAELRAMSYGRTEQHIQRKLTSALFDHVISLPLRFHSDRSTGAISQTLNNGLLGYRVVLQHLLLTVLPVVVELGTMAVVLLILDQATFLVVVTVSVLLYTVAFWSGAGRIGPPARAVSSARVAANAILTDSILNYETVKYFGAEPQMLERLTDALELTESQYSKLLTRKMENGVIVGTIFSCSVAVTAYLAAREVHQGDMSIGAFVLVNAYMLQIARPLEMIGFAFLGISEGMAFIQKLTELFDQKPESDSIECHTRLPSGTLSVAFDGVSYSHCPDRPALRGVSFSLPAGKTLGIVGASGSGKSSIVRLLARLVEPNEGEIRLGGVLLSSVPLSVLRAAISVVPQDVWLFNDSIAYNIGIGQQGSTEADIVAAAKVAQIHSFVSKLPSGYETQVGERGLKLSGGEKQRIAIARAAVRKSRLFILDEATSSLDSKTERAIVRDMIKAAGDRTTVIIAHRLSTIVHADEIVVLDGGTVSERGTHSELVRRRGAYAAMWHAQQMPRRRDKIASGA
jgi:ATP-binding cassette subfamily B protein